MGTQRSTSQQPHLPVAARFFPLWLLLLIGLGACSVTASEEAITASGFIEGEEVIVASEVTGRIAELAVERGDHVRAGQCLARLDDALLQRQRRQAAAGLAAAEAELARLRAGARHEEIRAARAALAQAEAERGGTARAVVEARDAISNPLQLEAEITQARLQVALAEQNVELARADLAETELQYNLYTGPGYSDSTGRTWQHQLEAAQAGLAQAEAELGGLRRYLNALLAIRANPLELEAQLHMAEARQRIAQADVEAAHAALAALETGATQEQLALAEARVREAEAAVKLVDARIGLLTLKAPMDGVVTARSAHTGETATAGVGLLTIADLTAVTLVVYVPQNRIGEVRIGQPVAVTVDAFPERTFSGSVAKIASEAEFTPRSVQTKEDRANLVFAVSVRIANPDRALKAGMPADAVLQP
jgi:HlyD family secretion protein